MCSTMHDVVQTKTRDVVFVRCVCVCVSVCPGSVVVGPRGEPDGVFSKSFFTLQVAGASAR